MTHLAPTPVRHLLRGLLLTGVLAVPALGATPATAAPLRECGRLPSAFAFNITTRAVSCPEARRIVRAWNRGPARGYGHRARGLRCRYRDLAHEYGDVRCTGSRGRVVRWQTGS